MLSRKTVDESEGKAQDDSPENPDGERDKSTVSSDRSVALKASACKCYSLCGQNEQRNMLGHDNVTSDEEVIAQPHLFQRSLNNSRAAGEPRCFGLR